MNKALLRYEMDRHKISTERMAAELGISRSSFWKKCNGISEFKQSEIKTMIELLDLDDPAAVFFADEVS